MTDSPFFSIIIPTYNREAFISKAVQSIIDQTFKNWELIVVDDGSTDNTSNIIASFKDERIKYIYQQNSERSVARNNGIVNSKGKYICFLDSDDTFFSYTLYEFYQCLSKNNFPEAVVFCDACTYDENNVLISKTCYRPINEILENYLFANSIGTVQTCINAALLKTEKFNSTITIGEDKELWLRLSAKTKFLYLPVPGIKVMDHSDRTIFLGNKNAVFGNLQTLKYIIKQPYARKISRSVKKKVFSNAYIKIGYHYSYYKKRTIALFWFLKGFFIAPHYRTKERLYLIISNTLTGKMLLKCRRKNKKISVK